jgi:hypothetical protein
MYYFILSLILLLDNLCKHFFYNTGLSWNKGQLSPTVRNTETRSDLASMNWKKKLDNLKLYVETQFFCPKHLELMRFYHNTFMCVTYMNICPRTCKFEM